MSGWKHRHIIDLSTFSKDDFSASGSSWEITNNPLEGKEGDEAANFCKELRKAVI